MKETTKETTENPTSNVEKEKKPSLLDRNCFGLLGDSLCLNYPFEMLKFEKVFFVSNKFDWNDLLMIFFPHHQIVPWSTKRHLVKHIVTKVHSLLEKVHSENFQEGDTLDMLVRFRKQMRLSYYSYLSLPDNIPENDREFYIQQYEALAVKKQSDQEFVEAKHKLKMLIFTAQDSYDVTKLVYGDTTPPEPNIPYFVGTSNPPAMLDVTKFSQVYVERICPEDSESDSLVEEESDQSDDSVSVKTSIKKVDLRTVLATPLYGPHFGQKYNVREILSSFPTLTSTDHKEKLGNIEMGLVMWVHNQELSDGGSNPIFYVDGGNRLTKCREYLSSLGFLRSREPQGDSLSARTVKWNNYRGKEGVGIDDTFPIRLRDCPMFGSYGHVAPMNDHPQVKLVKYVNVIFTTHPLDDNMRCGEHRDGCGRQLVEGDICKVDAGECQLIKGRVWNVAVKWVDPPDEKDNIKTSCKVGIVRVMYDQLHLVGNRHGMISTVAQGPVKNSTTQNLQNMCRGVAKLVFLN